MKGINHLSESCVRKAVTAVLVIVSGTSSFTILGQHQKFPVPIMNDTIDVFDEKLTVLHPEGGIEIKRKKIIKSLRQRYNVKKTHCVGGYNFDEFSYKFFHTNIPYPDQDDGGIGTWNIIKSMTDKISNGRFLRSGWYVRDLQYFYFLEKSRNGKDNQSVFMQFTFFEIDRKLAVIVYECTKAELLKQPPIQFSLALRNH